MDGYNNSILNPGCETNVHPLANVSENLAGQVENRPGQVEFCIGYIRDCAVWASAKKKKKVSQPVNHKTFIWERDEPLNEIIFF